MPWYDREEKRRLESATMFVPDAGSVTLDGPHIPGETYDPSEDDYETEPFFSLTFYPTWGRLKVKTLAEAKAVALETVEKRLTEMLDAIRRAK